MDDQIIRSYEEWKTCIASAYGRMTIAFIDERIGALEDTTNECSQKFIATYGQAHHRKVIAWLKQEKNQMENKR